MSTAFPIASGAAFQLRLFGGVRLEGPSGPLTGRAVQRRQLGVLAVLAASKQRSVTREKLIGLLWSDTTEAQARHHLSDALYALRRQLGDGAVVTAGGGLALDPEVVWSDAAAFDAALAAEDRETAAGLYTGPFLDGFYLNGGSTFEEWKEAERQRYASAYANTLEDLARAAETRGDFLGAVEWWHRFSTHDPYNSRVCLALMRNLTSAGDPANALKHLAEHARILHDELEIEPDRELLEYAERLRGSLALAPGVPSPSRPLTPPVTRSAESPSGPASAPGHHESAPDRAATARRVRLRWYATITLAAAVVCAAGFFALHDARPPRELDRNTIAVVPFTLTGEDSAATLLADRMANLVAGVLAGSPDFHVSDLAAVRREWDEAGGTRGTGLPVDAMRRIARASGAGTLLTGSVLQVSSTTRIMGELYDVETGRMTAQQALDVDPSNEAAAAERLLVRLLAQTAGEPRHRVPLLERHSREAVLTYLAARQETNRDRAIARAREALRLDSTLGWAALEWYQRINRESGWLERREAAAVLWNLRERMGPEDQTYVEALVGGRRRPIDDGRAEIARWERAVEGAPEWAVPRTALAAAVFLHGPLTGMPDWLNRAEWTFARAIALSDSSGGIEGAWWIAMSQHDTLRSRRLLAALEPHLGQDREYFRWATAVATGDSAGAARARKPGAWGNRHVFRSVALPRLAGAGTAAVDAYLAEIPSGADDPEHRTSGTQGYVDWYISYYERDRGHHAQFVVRRPFPTLERWQQYMAEIDARPYWATLLLRDALYLDAPEDSLVHRGLALLSRIADGDTLPPPEDGAVGIAHCWRSQWRLALGDTSGVDAGIRYLRDLELRAQAGEVPELDGGGRFIVCPALLEAQRARLLGRDAAPAIRRLDAILQEHPFPPEGYWFVTGIGTPTHDFTRILDNLLAGRMLAEIGDTAAALAAVRRRPHQPLFANLVDGYLVDFLREEGRFAATMGDTAGAIRAYRHYLALRPEPPDFPKWREEWEAVRREIAALTRAGRPHASNSTPSLAKTSATTASGSRHASSARRARQSSE